MVDCPLVTEIRQQAAGNLPLQIALVAGAAMEGGSLCGPWPSGDGGLACGPFQIRVDVHPVTCTQANDPAFAVRYAIRSLDYSGNAARYSSPIDVAFYSERPRHYYSAAQQAAAWRAIAQVFGETHSVEPPFPIPFVGCHPSNYRQGREAVEFEAVVIHTTAGGSTIGALDSWFNTPVGTNGKTPGSTHYGVDRAGVVHQYVRYTDTPIANGATAQATAAIVAENPSYNANSYTISIEHLDGGNPGSVTPVQLEASAQLTAWIFRDVLFQSGAVPPPAVNRRCVLGHFEFDPVNRKFCPSWPESRFNDYIARVQAIIDGPAPTPEPEPQPPDCAALERAYLAEMVQRDYDDLVRAQVRYDADKARLAAAGG